VRKVEPVFPDLLPISYRLGSLPASDDVLLDPVEMRLIWQGAEERPQRHDRAIPRRPVRLLVHARVAASEREHLARLLASGCGVLLVLDDHLGPGDFPQTLLPGQVVVLAPWVPPLWGGRALPDLRGWQGRGARTGVLVVLGPTPDAPREVRGAVSEARAAGAEFVLATPLAVPPEDRHRVYDRHAGEDGDSSLEDLFFHTDLLRLATQLEREVSRGCAAERLAEGLPGPATGAVSAATFASAAALLLWARRLDLLDGVSSLGWQLRRAARALLASAREPRVLIAEDNLRVIPGFSPWVEAFARSLWSGRGAPFDETAQRWLCE
jgi:hypothetical protein